MSTIININLHKAKTENSIWLYLQNGLGLLWILVSRSIYYLRARWYTFAPPTPYSYPEWSNKCYSVVCANVQPEEEIKHWPIKCPHSISTSTDNSLKMSMKKKDEKKLCSRANMEEKNHISYLKRTFYSEFITRSCVNSGVSQRQMDATAGSHFFSVYPLLHKFNEYFIYKAFVVLQPQQCIRSEKFFR